MLELEEELMLLELLDVELELDELEFELELELLLELFALTTILNAGSAADAFPSLTEIVILR
jgi:hypothetical protein